MRGQQGLVLLRACPEANAKGRQLVVRSKLPARELALAGVTLFMGSALLPASPVAAATPPDSKGGKRIKPEWLRKPGAKRPVGHDFDVGLAKDAERFRTARRRAVAAGGVHPVDGQYGYGEAMGRFGVSRPGHVHQGQDVFAPAGTPLVAVRDAIVVQAGSDGGRGNYVALYGPQARETYVYFHMEAPAQVEHDERLRAGDRVGRIGCTGSCSGDHLHFEVRRGRGSAGEAVDPLPLLRRLDR